MELVDQFLAIDTTKILASLSEMVASSYETQNNAVELIQKALYDLLLEEELNLNELLQLLDAAIFSKQLLDYTDLDGSVKLKRAFLNLHQRLTGKSTLRYKDLSAQERKALWPTFMLALVCFRQALSENV